MLTFKCPNCQKVKLSWYWSTNVRMSLALGGRVVGFTLWLPLSVDMFLHDWHSEYEGEDHIHCVCRSYPSSSVGQNIVVSIVLRCGLDGQGIESWWGKISCTCPDWPWGPPSLLYNGYQVSFPGVQEPWHGIDHPPHLVPRYLKSLWAFMAFSRVNFTFLSQFFSWFCFCCFSCPGLCQLSVLEFWHLS
jgi:hypothetical protein